MHETYIVVYNCASSILYVTEGLILPLLIYIYTLYGIQDPGPCIHVTVYTDPYPVPHETTNTTSSYHCNLAY